MSLPPALSLSDEARITIRNFLRKKFSGDDEGCCFFRRFNVLLSSPKNLIEITNHFGPNVSQTLPSLEGISAEMLKKNVELKYSKFAGFTTTRSIRDEPNEYADKEIYIHSNNYCQVDLSLEFTFKFNKIRQLCSPVTPQSGDLIFIFISDKKSDVKVEKDAKKPLKPRADMWCIVSEQFLHAWTLIQHDWHESFDKLITTNTPAEKKEMVLKEKIFSGNRLMTNSWLKYSLALAASGKAMTTEESKERYWFLRTEYASRKWVDIYAAIVLVGRYGELPCPVNVPNSKSVDPIRVSWCLPETFMTMFLQKGLGFLRISDHLVNYREWSAYSDASVMFSFFNKGKIKGFFDDIPTIKLIDQDGQKQTQNPNTTLSISATDFPAIIEIKHMQTIVDDRTWAKIVCNNNSQSDQIGTDIVSDVEKKEEKSTGTIADLQVNANSSANSPTNWAEVAQIDSDDW